MSGRFTDVFALELGNAGIEITRLPTLMVGSLHFPG